MAASVKEKNMPAISANIYGGLQKWVNRASLSIRERKRSRRNSDVSQTMYKPNPSEINGYEEEYSPTKIMPVHGRSRSTPVMIPDQDNYLMNIERNCRKTSEEPTVKASQREALLEPWHRQETKDDISRQRKRKDGRSQTLRRNCSKSESSLIEAIRNSESTSQTAPPKCRVRRTSSQDTEGSLESFTSDLDNNYNMNKMSRSSQASSKANIRDRTQTLGRKLDSNGVKPNEKVRSNSREKIAKDIKHRLDKWVEKTTGFHDSRQSSFESTSSSDDPSDVILFTRENNKAISNETREMRELQTALEELVSSCGRTSRKSSDDDQIRESIEVTNTRASRKVSLKDSGRMFSKAVDIDYEHCSQSVQQNEYRLKNCGSSISSTSSSESKVDETIQDKYSYETTSELEESYDSVDGKPMEKRRDNEVVESGHTKNSMNCDRNIGRGSDTTRALSMSPESLESEINNKSDHISSLESRSQNEGEEQCQLENWQFKYCVQQDNDCSLNETKQLTETSDHFSKQATVGGAKEHNEKVRHTKLLKSSKDHHAPPPPLTNANKELQEKKAKKSCDMTFNDVALDAFAEECLRYADKKEKIPSKERQSKSDSEEEKRSLKVDFIYIKKDIQSYLDRPVRKKSSTHPKTSYDEDRLTFAFSDNELERGEHLSRIRTKRNSVDSLDGRVLFNLEPSYHTDSKSKQNINDYQSIDSLHAEEDLATDNTLTGLRKFPSMPLFYVPKDFDSSGELVKHNKSSLRKSLWKRIKRLPRQTDNNRANPQSTKSKRKEEDTPSAQFVDPFYHGEKDEQQLSPIRTKAWTLDTTKINRPVSNQISRPSLETRRSVPLIKVAQVMKEEKSEKQADELLNDYEVIASPKSDESQC